MMSVGRVAGLKSPAVDWKLIAASSNCLQAALGLPDREIRIHPHVQFDDTCHFSLQIKGKEYDDDFKGINEASDRKNIYLQHNF